MLKFVLSVLVLLFSSQVYARGNAFHPGDFKGSPVVAGISINVVGHSMNRWFAVANPNGIKQFEFGQSCQTQEGIVSVIAVQGNWALVRYATSKKTTKEHCPSDTLFYESVDTINSLRWQERLANDKGEFLKQRKEAVINLLEKG